MQIPRPAELPACCMVLLLAQVRSGLWRNPAGWNSSVLGCHHQMTLACTLRCVHKECAGLARWPRIPRRCASRPSHCPTCWASNRALRARTAPRSRWSSWPCSTTHAQAPGKVSLDKLLASCIWAHRWPRGAFIGKPMNGAKACLCWARGRDVCMHLDAVLTVVGQP